MKNNIPLQKNHPKTKETSSGFDSSISYDFCFRLGWILFLGSEVKKTKAKPPTKTNKQNWMEKNSAMWNKVEQLLFLVSEKLNIYELFQKN